MKGFFININSYLLAGTTWAVMGLLAWKVLNWYSLALICSFLAFGCGFTVLSIYAHFFVLTKSEIRNRATVLTK